jgi:hypothetical protein
VVLDENDDSLTIALSADAPENEGGKANWLPAPDEQFALIVRTHVPNAAIPLNGSYKLPDVKRVLKARAAVGQQASATRTFYSIQLSCLVGGRREPHAASAGVDMCSDAPDTPLMRDDFFLVDL